MTCSKHSLTTIHKKYSLDYNEILLCHVKQKNITLSFFSYCCTVHSDIHTVHSPTDAHSLELGLKFTLKLDGSYIFRPTTIIRELAIEPG